MCISFCSLLYLAGSGLELGGSHTARKPPPLPAAMMIMASVLERSFCFMQFTDM